MSRLGRPTPARHFELGLAGVLLTAFVARAWYVVAVVRRLPLVGDAETYHLLGRVLASGHGYVRPRELLGQGLSLPTAEFPPLHPFVLALADLVGIDRPSGQRMVGAVLGVVTVALIALLARRIAGDRAGLVAGALAALSPVLIEHDTSVQAEGLFALLLAGSLLAIHVAMHRRTRPLDLFLLGLLLGATALTRSEALLLVPVAAVLVAWPARHRLTARAVVRALVLITGGALLVVGSWAVRSSVQLHGLVLTSTNAGTLIAGGNCDAVYDGPQKGLWRLDCVRAVDITGVEHDELGRTRRYVDAGVTYARGHIAEVPAVAAVHVLRTWGLWDPHGQIAWETLEGRDRGWHTVAHRVHLVTLALALGGFVVLRHRRRDLTLLLAPVVLSVLVSLVSGGNTRYRVGADVVLLVAAGIAVDAALARWWPRPRSPVSPAVSAAAGPARSPG